MNYRQTTKKLLQDMGVEVFPSSVGPPTGRVMYASVDDGGIHRSGQGHHYRARITLSNRDRSRGEDELIGLREWVFNIMRVTNLDQALVRWSDDRWSCTLIVEDWRNPVPAGYDFPDGWEHLRSDYRGEETS